MRRNLLPRILSVFLALAMLAVSITPVVAETSLMPDEFALVLSADQTDAWAGENSTGTEDEGFPSEDEKNLLMAAGMSPMLFEEMTTSSFDHHNIQFETRYLPAGTSVSVSYTHINPAELPGSGTETFYSPGPSDTVGTTPCTAFNFTFPAAITVDDITYELTRTDPASPYTTGGSGETTTITGYYGEATPAVPTVTTQPQDLTVTYGEDAVFTAAASGTATIYVQWEISTDDGDSWTEMSGEEDTTLTTNLPPVAYSGYQYRAVFTNSVGSDTSEAAVLTVDPKPASVTPDANGKTYGGSEAALTGTLSGFLTVDGVSAEYSRMEGENVSGSPYTISAVLSPESVLGNYDITYNLGEFTISPADPDINVTGGTFTYDGNAHPATATAIGVFGETVSGSFSFTYNGGTEEPVAVGTYGVSAIFTSSDSNYNAGSGTATITITDLLVATVEISGGPFTYDGAPKHAIVTTDPDGLDVIVTYSLEGETVEEPVNAGVYEVAAVVDDAEYAGSGTGTLAINPRTVTVTADDKTRSYNRSNPDFTASYTGFAAGEGLSDISGSPSFTTAATRTSLAGKYDIVPSLGTLSAANYSFTFRNGTLTIRSTSEGSNSGGVNYAPVNIPEEITRKQLVPECLKVNFLGNTFSVEISEEGALLEQLVAFSPDGVNQMVIPQGTIALDSNGRIVPIIDVKETGMPPLSEDQVGISQAYSFQPSGVNFSQPITITLGYGVNEISQGISSVGLAYYSDSDGWIILPTGGALAALGQSTGIVDHFTVFAVIAERAPASFYLSNLEVSSYTEKIWETVSFVITNGQRAHLNVDVVNDGGMPGIYQGTLKINGRDAEDRYVMLNPGQEGKLFFNLHGLEPGHYTVEIGGLQGELTVQRLYNYYGISGFSLLLVSAVSALVIFVRRRRV